MDRPKDGDDLLPGRPTLAAWGWIRRLLGLTIDLPTATAQVESWLQTVPTRGRCRWVIYRVEDERVLIYYIRHASRQLGLRVVRD